MLSKLKCIIVVFVLFLLLLILIVKNHISLLSVKKICFLHHPLEFISLTQVDYIKSFAPVNSSLKMLNNQLQNLTKNIYFII